MSADCLLEISVDIAVLASVLFVAITDSNELSLETLEFSSLPIAVPIEVTADNNALSFSKSIPLTKETISANWSKLTVEPSRIASILPFSVLIAVAKETLPDTLEEASSVITVLIEVLASEITDSNESSLDTLEEASEEIAEDNLESIEFSLTIAIDSFVETLVSIEPNPLEISPDNTTSTDVWIEQHSEISADNALSAFCLAVISEFKSVTIEPSATIALDFSVDNDEVKDKSPDTLEDASEVIEDVNEPSAAIALDSSALTSAILLDTSVDKLLVNTNSAAVALDSSASTSAILFTISVDKLEVRVASATIALDSSALTSAILFTISVDKLEAIEPSAAIALDSSALTSAVLSAISVDKLEAIDNSAAVALATSVET